MLEAIDPNLDWLDTKQSKFLQKQAPKCWELFFGKKYILPQYRQADYARQDFVNFMEWSTLIALPFSRYRDDIMNACFCNTAGGLYQGRPTLFMERELGHALVRTELPQDMVAEDFKWRWPAFRVYLPKDLIVLDKNGRRNSMMFIDIGLLEQDEGRGIPLEYARELDSVSAMVNGNKTLSTMSFEKFKFYYPDRAIVICGILNLIDGLSPQDLTTYAMVKPFAKYTVKELCSMTDKLKSAWSCDIQDDQINTLMEHVALQTLLFLSAYPIEYAPDKVLRKPSAHGNRHISGLYAARFVGSSQIRPDNAGHHIAKMMTPSEYFQMSHWRCGHWKRQPYGPKLGQRRLIWINPYKAGREEEEEIKK
jgi:hypothetical protein